MTPLLQKFIRDVPIRRKLMTLILMTSGITLFVASLIFIAREAMTIEKGQRSDLVSLAGIVGKNTVSALAFNDPQSAMDTMASLAVKPNIIAAYLFDNDYRLFSKYVASAANTENLPLEKFGANVSPDACRSLLKEIHLDSGQLFNRAGYASIVQPILLDGDKVGTLLFHSDTSRVISNLLWSIFIMLLIMAGAFVMAYFISSRLQRLISTPILNLVEMMKFVSETKDFTLRATKPSSDEIGLLYEGFNEMLCEIEERNQILQQRQDHLQKLAHYDPLTRLANRTLYLDRLNQAISYSKRERESVAVYFIDLDHFKDINDTLGHKAGDALLMVVAQRLDSIVRDSDTVARLGGDEFTIFTQNIKTSDNACIVARKILDLFGIPFQLEGKNIFVTASIGITLFPFDGENVDELLMNADIAMYYAKESGKNTYKLYSRGMNERASERVALQSDLRLALEREEFILYYQPKIDMASGHVSSVEALIRWKHPEKGLIFPDKFIQLAEETGLIEGITEWVLLTACRQAKAWQEAGYQGIRVAVNISPYNFRRQNVLETVIKVLRETGIDATLLEIEMTESSLMQNDEYIIEALAALQLLGIKVAIDDFGTGYSSLSNLHRFPIDSLKIDRSFVWNMTKSKEDMALVTAIIAMANSLKMDVVAEGVETAEQLNILRDKGCHEIQGYLFSKPLPPENIVEMFGKKLTSFG